MPIIERHEKPIRTRVRDYICEKKLVGTFTVIDVGGASNTWCDGYVDAYLDMNPVATTKQVFTGDINRVATWDQFRENQFDFSICTHVLEDIRDPVVAIEGLSRISRAGFIATPTKFAELANLENPAWPGNCHHRWIFDVTEEYLTFFPKLPALFYFAWQNLPVRLANTPWLGRVAHKIGIKRSPTVFGPGLGIGKRYVAGDELGILWDAEIPYRCKDYFSSHYDYLDFCRAFLTGKAA